LSIPTPNYWVSVGEQWIYSAIQNVVRSIMYPPNIEGVDEPVNPIQGGIISQAIPTITMLWILVLQNPIKYMLHTLAQL